MLLPEILKMVDIKQSRLLLEKSPDKKLDYAFVEGSAISKNDIERLKKIRENSRYLVALGACAIPGGIPKIRNSLPEATQKKLVRQARSDQVERVYAIGEIVKVDFALRQCPIDLEELQAFIVKVYHGIKPQEQEVPVCKECKQRNNRCLLLEGQPCLGPVTYAGCNALCPTENVNCTGCRGFTKDANLDKLLQLFRDMGIDEKVIYSQFTYFNDWPFKGEKHA